MRAYVFRFAPNNGHPPSTNAMFEKCRCHERLERDNKVGKLKEQICLRAVVNQSNSMILSCSFQVGQQECLHIGWHNDSSDHVRPKGDWGRGNQLFRE